MNFRRKDFRSSCTASPGCCVGVGGEVEKSCRTRSVQTWGRDAVSYNKYSDAGSMTVAVRTVEP